MIAASVLVHARPTREQLLQAKRHYLARSSLARRVALFCFLAPLVAAVLWLLLADHGMPRNLAALLVAAPVVGVALLAAAAYGGVNHPRTRALLAVGVQYRLSAEGLSVRDPVSEAELPWKDLTRADELPGLLVVRVGPQMHLLPLADFPPRGLEAARALLREHLGERARLRGA